MRAIRVIGIIRAVTDGGLVAVPGDDGDPHATGYPAVMSSTRLHRKLRAARARETPGRTAGPESDQRQEYPS
jgi:hypothetical protein